MKKYIGQGPEVPQVQEPQSQWSWGMQPSQHMDVFANSESPQIPLFRCFLWKCHYLSMLVAIVNELNLQVFLPPQRLGERG